MYIILAWFETIY